MNRLILVIFLFLGLFSLGIYFFMMRYTPVAAVVPHHDLVKRERQDFLQKLLHFKPKIQKIIVIGPDHFSSRQDLISFSDRSWSFENGFLESFLMEGIESIGVKDNLLILQDHSITSVLPDIQMYWPNSRVQPIILGEAVNKEKVDALANLLFDSCGRDCLLISSVDFSHFVPWPLANIHDVFTIKQLKSIAIDGSRNIEVDSPLSLYVMSRFAAKKNANSFVLLNHTNSGEISGNITEYNTSHVFGYYAQGFIDMKEDFWKNIQSFTLANNENLHDFVDLDRHLRGTDVIDLDINEKFCIDDKICFSPSEGDSELNCEVNKLQVKLGDDLLVGLVVKDSGWYMSLHPYQISEELKFFISDEERVRLNDLFDLECENIYFDKPNGTVYSK